MLNDLISEYHFIEYSGISFSYPIMYVLQNGCFRNRYPSNFHNTKEGGYGLVNPKLDKLFDHFYAFRTIDKKVYYVTNPWLQDYEARAILEDLRRGNIKNFCPESKRDFDSLYGSYKDLKYTILGKGRSYYYPGETNLILLYV